MALGSARHTDEVCVLPGSGLAFERGTEVLMPIYLIHRSEEYWGADADRFEPDRFSVEAIRERGTLGAMPFFPFSLGPRNCIGQFFATFTALVVTAVLVPRYDFELACDRREVAELHSFTMRPSVRDTDGRWVGLPMRVSSRRAAVGRRRFIARGSTENI